MKETRQGWMDFAMAITVNPTNQQAHALFINPQRACAGGLRYLSCLSVCVSVTT